MAKIVKVTDPEVLGMDKQADGVSFGDQADQEAESKDAVEPSGPQGDNPSTAGPGATNVKSNTPENRLGRINPSAPEDANTTPGSLGEKGR